MHVALRQKEQQSKILPQFPQEYLLLPKCRVIPRNLATDGSHILAVTMTEGNLTYEECGALSPSVNQRARFPRYVTRLILSQNSLGQRSREPPSFR
jgi:hypothetical protein